MGETYYEVLGVSPDATPEEITAAYRERVLETHPDRCEDGDAMERFQRVRRAEAVLSDSVERARYDRLGHEAYVADARSGRSEPDPADDPAAAAAWVTRGDDTRERSTRGHSDTTGDAGPVGPGFRYDVHDWTGDVDLEDQPVTRDHSTRVAAGTIGLAYPLFVYSSVTPALPLTLNATVAVATLVLVGWLLTMPGFAIPAFGGWSVLVTGALITIPPVQPLSLTGAVILACFWVPFGYAVAVWWALRP